MNIFRPIAPLIRKLAKIYTSKERTFSFKDIEVIVKPGVFHPGLFISTKMLLNFVEKLNLEQQTFLELGAGSGIISILAAKKGAKDYASDISGVAIENIKLNAYKNEVEISVIKSDLFQNLTGLKFDFIIINPPYYKKDPANEEEYAWYCGGNHEYFIKLFDSLKNYINKRSNVYMILSEVCDINLIKSIGTQKGYSWSVVKEKIVWGERNYIYSIMQD